MKIGLYLNNEDYKNVNLGSIHLGNPGIGGTDFWFYSLAYFLTGYYKDVNCVFFTTARLNLLKGNISNVIVTDVMDGVKKAKDNKIDIFIINKHVNINDCDLKDLCKLIDKVKLSTVTVGHNFYSKKECDLIAKCKFIKRNVFVSKQQYNIYSDLDIYKKSLYIYNFLNTKNIRRRLFPPGNIVTYTGSITNTKGFHVLARNWKKILKYCPDAKLNVIGSGKLYSRDSILGNYGIADENYEKIFMPFLSDDNGKILDSVSFLGLLKASEIYPIYQKTAVGIVNPSGISECCSISSIEFAANGVPIVSKRYGGLLDTVLDKKTGLLVRNDKELISAIVRLLKNHRFNTVYSKNAYSFARLKFSSKENVGKWHNLFKEIISDKTPNPVQSKLYRKIRKIIYALQVGRPPLIKKESLNMPFNNYEKYSKPGIEEFLLVLLRGLIKFKSILLGKIYNILLIPLFGKFVGVKASKIADSEKLIFPEEKFVMPELKDIFGKKHKDFYAYEMTIPPFYVRNFKNAYCVTNREEVFSSEKEVVSEYTSQKVNPLIGMNKKILFSKNIKKINGSVAHLSMSGLESNYYHFLTECLGRLYLIERSKLKPDFYIISDNLSFQREWLSLLGIDRDRIISANVSTVVQAKELIVPSFINNWEFVNFRGQKYYQKKWVPGWIANLYKEKIIPNVKINTPKKIYISRNGVVGRKVENEKEVSQLFKDSGFGVYNLETMSVREQIELFTNASIIAGIHGAGFINMNFAPSTARIFEIFPEYYHDASYRVQATALGLRYYYMIGKTRNTRGIHPQQEEAYINIKILRKALDIILGKEEITNVK